MNKILQISFICLLSLLVNVAYAQQSTVSGTVAGPDGEGLPGVTVLLKGTTTGTITDVDGKFSISVASSEAVLVFSSVGMESQEITVGSRSVIDIQMAEDLKLLEEVVVVGYGTMERTNVTGAIATVDMAEIHKVPVPNVVETLRGQVAGLRVQRSSGQPGSGVSFLIRGNNSLGGGLDPNSPVDNFQDANKPIIVVDGVPIPEGNLNELNPDDIESINVIKDAGAGAIYGSSAANGVVLITTKNGTVGRPSINVNYSGGFNDLSYDLPIMNGDQYLKYLFDSGQGTTVNEVLDANEVANYVNGDEVDWQDLLLRKGAVHNASVSVSGGTEKLRFYMNGDVYLEEGIVDYSNYNRYSLRFNTDYQAADWVKIGTRIQLTKSFADQTSNVLQDFPGARPQTFAPFIPILENTPLGDVYDDEGNTVKLVRDDRFQINPLHRYLNSDVDRDVTRSYVNPYLEFNIIEGLKYTLNTFAEQRDEFYGRWTGTDYADGDPSTAQIQKQSSTTYLMDNILNYKKVFGAHGIDATLVYGFQNNRWEQIDAFSDKLATDLLGYHAIDVTATVDQRFNWDTDEWGRIYLVGRVGYDFEDKYVATLTVRRDGSSKYTGDNKWGTFPSYSVAWNAHNESFWGTNWFINEAKVRLSYGTLGNDRIPTYSYRANPRVTRSSILVDDGSGELVEQPVVGYAKQTLANPGLKWETSKQLNFGLDMGFFNDRLYATVDIFSTKTTDVLLPEIIPVINGYQSYINNVGETENSGFEISLKGTVYEAGDFSWTSMLNFAGNKSKIVKLNRYGPDGEPTDDEQNNWFLGQDPQEVYTFKQIGVWQVDEADEAELYGFVPGDAKYLDVNGDGQITAGEDRVFLGNPTPDFFGGFNNVFRYKGFELSVMLEFVQGVTVLNNFYGGFTGRGNQLAVDYWTEESPSNRYPRAGSDTWNGYGESVKYEDASFIALRNVSLAYNFPSSLLDKTPIKAVNVYVRGNNLKYWTDMEYAYSPETGRGEYPIVQNWTFGTAITF